MDWSKEPRVDVKPGDYVIVEVTEVKGHGLRGRLLCRSSIAAFEESGLSRIDAVSLAQANLVKEAYFGEEASGAAFVA